MMSFFLSHLFANCIQIERHKCVSLQAGRNYSFSIYLSHTWIVSSNLGETQRTHSHSTLEGSRVGVSEWVFAITHHPLFFVQRFWAREKEIVTTVDIVSRKWKNWWKEKSQGPLGKSYYSSFFVQFSHTSHAERGLRVREKRHHPSRSKQEKVPTLLDEWRWYNVCVPVYIVCWSQPKDQTPKTKEARMHTQELEKEAVWKREEVMVSEPSVLFIIGLVRLSYHVVLYLSSFRSYSFWSFFLCISDASESLTIERGGGENRIPFFFLFFELVAHLILRLNTKKSTE